MAVNRLYFQLLYGVNNKLKPKKGKRQQLYYFTGSENNMKRLCEYLELMEYKRGIVRDIGYQVVSYDRTKYYDKLSDAVKYI